MPTQWSNDAIDFINKLIQRKPIRRLGINGPQEVKQHNWLRNFPWDELNNMTLTPPYKPSDSDNFDVTNSQSEWKDENEQYLRHSLELLRRDSVQEMFKSYEYDEMRKAN